MMVLVEPEESSEFEAEEWIEDAERYVDEWDEDVELKINEVDFFRDEELEYAECVDICEYGDLA